MTCLHHNRICVAQVGRILCWYCLCISMFEFDFSTKRVYVLRISCKDLKSMLSQVNYRVPNMRFLREKLPVHSHLSHTLLSQSISLLFSPFNMVLSQSVDLWFVINNISAYPLVSVLALQDSELRNGDVSFSQFAQLYRSLMFDAQKNVSAVIFMYAQIVLSQHFHPPVLHLIPCQGTLPPPSACSQMAARSIRTS